MGAGPVRPCPAAPWRDGVGRRSFAGKVSLWPVPLPHCQSPDGLLGLPAGHLPALERRPPGSGDQPHEGGAGQGQPEGHPDHQLPAEHQWQAVHRPRGGVGARGGLRLPEGTGVSFRCCGCVGCAWGFSFLINIPSAMSSDPALCPVLAPFPAPAAASRTKGTNGPRKQPVPQWLSCVSPGKGDRCGSGNALGRQQWSGLISWILKNPFSSRSPLCKPQQEAGLKTAAAFRGRRLLLPWEQNRH